MTRGYAPVIVPRLLALAALCMLASCIDGLDTDEVTQQAGTPTIATDRSAYTAAQAITVTWMNSPGNPFDFVALMPAGSPAQSPPVAWSYTNGKVDGSIVFGPITTSGNYEARLYLGGSYTILATSSFVVTNATISTDKSIYSTADTSINVTWSGLPGAAGEYVAIAVAGSSSTLQTSATNGAASGMTSFTNPGAGSYEARAYSGSGVILASSSFEVSSASVTTDKASYAPNQSITITWSGATGNTSDYIAVMPAGSPAQSTPVQWFYLYGATSGSRTIPGVAAGSYEARMYLHNSYTVLASTSFSVAATCTVGTQPVVSSVTSGDMVIDSMSKYANVAMTPAMASSILFTTVRESEPSPAYGGVVCYLHDALTNPMLPAGLLCSRGAAGTDTGNGTINVHWTVVTFSSGVTVQRGIANTGTMNPASITLSTINPAESFVILNGVMSGGSGWGNNEFARAQITGSTSLEVRNAIAGSQIAWQVVDMQGASVQRGTTSLTSSATSANVTISTVPSGSVPFVSYTSDNASGIAAAALMLQSRLSNSTTLVLSRSVGGSSLDVAWEVVSLPFATYSGVTNLSAGQGSASVNVAGISGTQSVGVCSTEALLGASTGSTTYQGSGGSADLVGEAAVTLTTAAGTLGLSRTSTQGSASIPWTVIDFSKNCAGN